MSKIGERIAYQINQLFPPLHIHRDLEKAKLDISENQAWSLAEARRVVKYFGPYWDLKGKHLLDIGTGIGGKLKLYEEWGVSTITGIDIHPKSVTISRKFLQDQTTPGSSSLPAFFSVSDAANMPFADNSFDAIVSINVFEHIIEVEKAIYETFRVVKPDGVVFLHVPPYYGPWGPHLENWIHFPWPHLLFSDRTLLRVAEREDKKRPLNDQFMYAAQVDWNADRIQGINRVSFREFDRMIRQAGFSINSLTLLPVGYEFLPNQKNVLAKLIFKVLQMCTRIPLIQEVIITKMVYVLSKPKQQISQAAIDNTRI